MTASTMKPGRRGFLTVGALAGVGLTLSDFFKLQQAQAEQKHYDHIEAKAKSVIHIYLPGGSAHQESWDPKPFAPVEYRGEMGTIKTNTGEVFSETLPKTAQIADKITVVRSMSHGEAAHERGFLEHRHEPGHGTSVSVSARGREHLRKAAGGRP